MLAHDTCTFDGDRVWVCNDNANAVRDYVSDIRRMVAVTSRQFQETGTTCVECPTCGARRTLKSPKDQPHFPSHPRRLSPPAKGERRWVFQQQSWKLVEG